METLVSPPATAVPSEAPSPERNAAAILVGITPPTEPILVREQTPTLESRPVRHVSFPSTPERSTVGAIPQAGALVAASAGPTTPTSAARRRRCRREAQDGSVHSTAMDEHSPAMDERKDEGADGRQKDAQDGPVHSTAMEHEDEGADSRDQEAHDGSVHSTAMDVLSPAMDEHKDEDQELREHIVEEFNYVYVANQLIGQKDSLKEEVKERKRKIKDLGAQLADCKGSRGSWTAVEQILGSVGSSEALVPRVAAVEQKLDSGGSSGVGTGRSPSSRYGRLPHYVVEVKDDGNWQSAPTTWTAFQPAFWTTANNSLIPQELGTGFVEELRVEDQDLRYLKEQKVEQQLRKQKKAFNYRVDINGKIVNVSTLLKKLFGSQTLSESSKPTSGRTRLSVHHQEWPKNEARALKTLVNAAKTYQKGCRTKAMARKIAYNICLYQKLVPGNAYLPFTGLPPAETGNLPVPANLPAEPPIETYLQRQRRRKEKKKEKEKGKKKEKKKERSERKRKRRDKQKGKDKGKQRAEDDSVEERLRPEQDREVLDDYFKQCDFVCPSCLEDLPENAQAASPRPNERFTGSSR
ncbi:uncharacterized protein EV422DRAFT_509968 [Fimicolochytrium jonesii]|uniref:uncharacterized protein n=1 Tax=Fimicolochytrium jonesii TaxID=1396493 RepID=UPI0022FE4B97|nr:uncharacterized protein EV422DRAFT_509968 [Fimicolochytrium jonesii]KAI8816238.1 hypothetical protein EV422DRAFT_509968 [Fimicolochytrium jonesii]